jgi:hypothetical protein
MTVTQQDKATALAAGQNAALDNGLWAVYRPLGNKDMARDAWPEESVWQREDVCGSWPRQGRELRL